MRKVIQMGQKNLIMNGLETKDGVMNRTQNDDESFNSIELHNATIEICCVCGELSYIISALDEFCTNPLCPTNLDEEEFIEEFVNRLLAEEYEEYINESNNTGVVIQSTGNDMFNIEKEDFED